MTLRHFSFANCIIGFFFNYLVNRSTQYSWNSFLSGACDTNVGMRQDSTLYTASLICIFEHGAQVLNLSSFILLFIDNSLLIS